MLGAAKATEKWHSRHLVAGAYSLFYEVIFDLLEVAAAEEPPCQEANFQPAGAAKEA
jgi:hypothetical protein